MRMNDGSLDLGHTLSHRILDGLAERVASRHLVRGLDKPRILPVRSVGSVWLVRVHVCVRARAVKKEL